jgi:hypothetical protein
MCCCDFTVLHGRRSLPCIVSGITQILYQFISFFLKCFCICCNSLKGWRTMLVIPELEREVKLLSDSKTTRKVVINVHLLFFL